MLPVLTPMQKLTFDSIAGNVEDNAALAIALDQKLNIADAPSFSTAKLQLFLDDAGGQNLLTVPSLESEKSDSTVVNNNTVLIETYKSAVLGITNLQAGVYNYMFWASCSNTANISTLVFKWYKQLGSAAMELLYTHETAHINSTTIIPVVLNYTEVTAKAILETEHLVLEIYAKTTRTSNVTVTYMHSGSLRNSHIDTPIEQPINSALKAALDLKADKLQYCTKEILIGGAEVLDGATDSADAYTVLTNIGSVIIRNFGGAAGNVNSNVKINFRMPDDYVTGTPIKYSVAGTISNATKLASGEKVAFSLAGCVITDNIGLDLAVGTAVVVSKTASADYVQYKRWETAFSSDVTLTDAAPNGYVKLNLIRVTDNANDTYAKPIGVSSITIKYQKSVQSV